MRNDSDALRVFAACEYIISEYGEEATIVEKEIRQFKIDPSLCEKLGEILEYSIINRYPGLLDNDLIISVPSSNFEKGFDQASLLAKYLHDRFDLPYLNILEKDRSAKAQHNLNADQKSTGIIGSFSCNIRVDGKRVLLIDDTMITRSTMKECAKVLKIAGAASVTGLVIGRGIDKTHKQFLLSEDEQHGLI